MNGIDIYEKENPKPTCKELSCYKTWINGRPAIIRIIEETESVYASGTWRYLDMIMVNNKYICFITCVSKSEDFDRFEQDFQNIVNSFKILSQEFL